LNLPDALLSVAVTVAGLAVTKNPRVLVEAYSTLFPVAEAALITAVWNVLGVTPETGHKSIHTHARLFTALAYSTRKVTVLAL
jgi:membrane-associated protease RseP (regulator of RpoE activity)